jgi:hypothetical protein
VEGRSKSKQNYIKKNVPNPKKMPIKVQEAYRTPKKD